MNRERVIDIMTRAFEESTSYHVLAGRSPDNSWKRNSFNRHRLGR